MKLINSVNDTRYRTIDTIFISEYKWEFLADKYRITLNAEEWTELETEYHHDWDEYPDEVTNILYADVSGHCCLDVFDDYSYNEVERLLKHSEVLLYTNEDKDFHILVQSDY